MIAPTHKHNTPRGAALSGERTTARTAVFNGMCIDLPRQKKKREMTRFLKNGKYTSLKNGVDNIRIQLLKMIYYLHECVFSQKIVEKHQRSTCFAISGVVALLAIKGINKVQYCLLLVCNLARHHFHQVMSLFEKKSARMLTTK